MMVDYFREIKLLSDTLPGLEPEQFLYEAAIDLKRIDKECA